MRTSPRFALLALLVLSRVLGAQTEPPAGADGVVDLSNFLGMSPAETYELLGAPQEVLAAKTAEDILQLVHFYADSIYLFWYRNRVWQLRLDQRYRGRFMGLSMGQSREQVETLIGPPRHRSDDWFTYDLPVLGFPRRLRLKFTNNRLVDLYYYRSDL